MIVSPRFAGDEDTVTMWVQHDCYGEALGILTSVCAREYAAASAIAGPEDDELRASRAVKGVDHRTLQDCHDHLAAFWRGKSNRTQPALDFGSRDKDARRGWLDWLSAEVAEWREWHPRLIRHVATIMVFQNVKRGYAAEEALLAYLKDAYPLDQFAIKPVERSMED